MKYTKILILFSFMFGMISNTVQADDYQSNTYSFGVINAVYQNELRIVINDSSINFNSVSDLRDQYDETILNISGELKKGVYVKYQTSQTSNSTKFLTNLKVISKYEFDEHQENERKDDH